MDAAHASLADLRFCTWGRGSGCVWVRPAWALSHPCTAHQGTAAALGPSSQAWPLVGSGAHSTVSG